MPTQAYQTGRSPWIRDPFLNRSVTLRLQTAFPALKPALDLPKPQAFNVPGVHFRITRHCCLAKYAVRLFYRKTALFLSHRFLQKSPDRSHQAQSTIIPARLAQAVSIFQTASNCHSGEAEDRYSMKDSRDLSRSANGFCKMHHRHLKVAGQGTMVSLMGLKGHPVNERKGLVSLVSNSWA